MLSLDLAGFLAVLNTDLPGMNVVDNIASDLVRIRQRKCNSLTVYRTLCNYDLFRVNS